MVYQRRDTIIGGDKPRLDGSFATLATLLTTLNQTATPLLERGRNMRHPLPTASIAPSATGTGHHKHMMCAQSAQAARTTHAADLSRCKQLPAVRKRQAADRL